MVDGERIDFDDDQASVILSATKNLWMSYTSVMSEDDEKIKRKLSWREFWVMLGPSMKKHTTAYVFSIFFIIVASLAQVAEPIVYGKIVDVLIGGGGDLMGRILPLIGWWAGAFLVSIGLLQTVQWIGWWIAVEVGNDFMAVALRRILFWDADRFGRDSSGAIAKRLDKAWDRSFDVSGRMLSDVGPSIATFFFVLVSGLFLDWRMTIAALVTVPFAALLTFRTDLRAQAKQGKLEEAWEGLSTNVHETLTNILPIKIFAGEERTQKQQMEVINEVGERQHKLHYLWAGLGFGTGVVRLGSRVIVLLVGAYFISEGSLTVGKMVTFLGMLNYILAPF
ncbi:MAG: ABC transporter ATP-binding protein, partial [Methylococcaceae bacterium]